MLTVRMLVILYGLKSASDAADTVLRAVQTAKSPYRLRFAVPPEHAHIKEALTGDNAALAAGDIHLFDAGKGLNGIHRLLADESHFLLIMGAHSFSEGWDEALCRRLKRAGKRGALLTASLSDAESRLPSQAYLPGLSREATERGAPILRGLPLTRSHAPVRTLIIDPAFLFGTVDFLREDLRDIDTLSIAAYARHRDVFALDIAPLQPLAPPPPRYVRLSPDALPGTTVSRFEQQAALHIADGITSEKARMGLFFVESTYRQKLPLRLKARYEMRGTIARLKESGYDMPLLTTAFIDLPMPDKPISQYMLRFGFMSSIKSLPLLAYTGGSQERYLRAAFPNTRSYPSGKLIPDKLRAQGLTSWQHFKRSKLALLALTIEKHPEFSHIAWANIDLVKHPICDNAMPDFSKMMDDRVHIATVKGVPDCSFFVVPAKHIPLLAREALNQTLNDADLRRGFSERELWTRLIDGMPQLFTLHPMQEKHLLMLSAFERELLCAEARVKLSDTLPPIILTPKGSCDNGIKKKKIRIGKPRRTSTHHHARRRKLRL